MNDDAGVGGPGDAVHAVHAVEFGRVPALRRPHPRPARVHRPRQATRVHTLGEIADLTIAWDGGQRGPLQDRLRNVVADKLATAQQQIVELTTLISELQRAATTLERHRPDGPCDEQCGSVTDTADAEEAMTRQVIRLGKKPDRPDRTVPIACTLTSQSMRGRLTEWQQLLAHVVNREPVDHGLRARWAGNLARRDDPARRCRAGLLPVLRLRDHRRHPRDRARGSLAGGRPCGPAVTVRSPGMSIKKACLTRPSRLNRKLRSAVSIERTGTGAGTTQVSLLPLCAAGCACVSGRWSRIEMRRTGRRLRSPTGQVETVWLSAGHLSTAKREMPDQTARDGVDNTSRHRLQREFIPSRRGRGAARR